MMVVSQRLLHHVASALICRMDSADETEPVKRVQQAVDRDDAYRGVRLVSSSVNRERSKATLKSRYYLEQRSSLRSDPISMPAERRYDVH